MKKIIFYLKFIYYYLKGVIQFRAKDFSSAQFLFEKANKYYQGYKNKLFCQYYGQTLMALGQTEEAYTYLSKSYELYDEKGWIVSDDEEYRLAQNTLDALKHLEVNHGLKIENVVYNQVIRRK